MPVASRETVSPSALKLTLTLAVVVVVGVKRTVTVWVAPAPTRVKGLPDTMLNGGETDAVPVMAPLRVLLTVNVWSTKAPTFTLPNVTVAVGLTLKSACAIAFAPLEHALSLPLVSTART